MGNYAEYIQKSNELFGIINGKFEIVKNDLVKRQEYISKLKKEYESLLNDVAFSGEYPVGTSKDECRDPIAEGYLFRMEQKSFTPKEAKTAYEYFKGFGITLKDTGDCYIGSIAATKKISRYVVLTKNLDSIKAIELLNELFYKTPPVLMMTVDADGKPVWLKDRSPIRTASRGEGNADSGKKTKNSDLPTTSWDTLD